MLHDDACCMGALVVNDMCVRFVLEQYWFRIRGFDKGRISVCGSYAAALCHQGRDKSNFRDASSAKASLFTFLRTQSPRHCVISSATFVHCG